MAMGLGMDVGTAHVVIANAAGEVVLHEPSVIAVQRGSGRVLACGQRARAMLGRHPDSVQVLRPIRKGVISDYRYAEILLCRFVRQVCSYKIVRPHIAVTQPAVVTGAEKRSLIEAVSAAGVRRVMMMEKAVASLIGAGVDVTRAEGCMVADLGAGTTEVAVMSLSGTAAACSLRVGGDDLDEAIVRYVRETYHHLIGLPTAEWLKCEIGAARPLAGGECREVKGRCLHTGLPCLKRVTAEDVHRAIKEPLERMLLAVQQTMEQTLPDLAGDIMKNGMVLTGGTARLHGLPEYFTEQTGIPCRVAVNPTACGARGAYTALMHRRAFSHSTYTAGQFDRADELWN